MACSLSLPFPMDIYSRPLHKRHGNRTYLSPSTRGCEFFATHYSTRVFVPFFLSSPFFYVQKLLTRFLPSVSRLAGLDLVWHLFSFFYSSSSSLRRFCCLQFYPSLLICSLRAEGYLEEKRKENKTRGHCLPSFIAFFAIRSSSLSRKRKDIKNPFPQYKQTARFSVHKRLKLQKNNRTVTLIQWAGRFCVEGGLNPRCILPSYG